MDDNKSSKQNSCSRYRWSILIVTLFIILAVILTTIFVIQTKRNSQPSMVNTSIINEKHNVSYEEYALKKFDECFIL
jgi:hypothetical protein